jgi:hypothetical protein
VRTVIGILRGIIVPITPRLVEIGSTLEKARAQLNQHLLETTKTSHTPNTQ